MSSPEGKASSPGGKTSSSGGEKSSSGGKTSSKPPPESGLFVGKKVGSDVGGFEDFVRKTRLYVEFSLYST